MDLFNKVIKVLSSTKADNARQSSGSPCNLQDKTMNYFSSDSVTHSQTLNAVHPQGKSGFEATVPPTQALHPQVNAVPYVVMNGYGFEGTVPSTQSMNLLVCVCCDFLLFLARDHEA